MKNELLGKILDENKFSYENMTIEEQNYYLNIVRHCKDICDSSYKVAGEGKCELVALRFKKDNRGVNVDGILTIGNEKLRENRYIDSIIFSVEDSIIVNTCVIGLCAEDKIKEYMILDEFKIENGKLKRTSQYSYDTNYQIVTIEDDLMRGSLK